MTDRSTTAAIRLVRLDPTGSDRGALLLFLTADDFDLSDPVPLFDLRIAGSHRGHGLGVPALRALTDHVFRTLPEVTRFEGQTRDDNTAMRRVFGRAGWVKEAHYREGWPVAGGSPRASVGYGILRRGWETGTTTPAPWDDSP
ncbi:GNAT family protein [Curtobacterium sp. PhB136]|uniref:GNAT family N-acetyltransferase n=1 Tax=Curtobacterium sp. PhB136 TaxID=2485181 RepID=UPI0010521A89|nr:GNAT family protein [Curtobacterium sp. PhB136]TCK64379.1 acetyltransferase (GNAT) family protein [Curtobacterium sp. PhB136]